MPHRLAALALLCLAAPAFGREVTLEDALASASGNRDHRQAARQVDAARADLQTARATWDPTLVASGEVSGTTSSGFLAGYPLDSATVSTRTGVGLRGATAVGTSWEIGADLGRDRSTTVASLGGAPATEQTQKNWDGLVDLSVTQDLLAPFRRSDSAIAARQARERVDQADLTANGAAEQAVFDIASAWWAWAAADRRSDAAGRALDAARTLEALTATWVDEGRVARLELDRVTADRLGTEADLLTADAEVRRTADVLLLAMGEAPGTPIEPGGDGSIAGGEIDPGASLERALDQNPDLRLARARVDAARANARDAGVAGLPTLDLSGSVGMASLADTALEALTRVGTDGLPRWAVGLDVAVPLGGRASRASRDRASADLDVALIGVESAEATVRAQVRAAADAVQTARQGVELARARWEVARSTEAGEQARVDEGVLRLDDLLTARNTRLLAEDALVDAERQRAAAELDLLAVEGRLGGAV